MDAISKDVSNRSHGPGASLVDHRNPLTSHGVRLPGGAELLLQIHECGSVVHHHDDWGFKQVVSPFWRVYHNARPGCAIVFRGERIALGPTRAVFVPERIPFDCESRPGVPHLWMHFSLDHALGAAAPAPLVLELDRALRQEFTRLRRAVAAPGARLALAHQSAGLLHLCLARLTDRLAARPVSPRLRRLIGFIDQMLGSPLPNETLAARVGLSPGAFGRWFRRETGETPAVYVTGRRVREACRRLAFTDASIEEIAEAVGFADRHHFSRIFKTRLGCGPAAFRNQRDWVSASAREPAAKTAGGRA